MKDDLQSADPARVATALADIKAAAATRGRGFAGPTALNVLFDLKRYDDIDQIALAQILSNPTDSAYTSAFTKARARALAAAGKLPEALVCARSYYNVVPLNLTQDAVDLLTGLLNQGHPDQSLGDEFLQQQVAWAASDATTQPSAPTSKLAANVIGEGNPEGSANDLGVLSTIPADPAPYAQAIAAITSGRSADVLAKGNLLLLAGRADEARKLYEESLPSARGSSVAWIIESIARSIRAQTGKVALANAFVLSMERNE